MLCANWNNILQRQYITKLAFSFPSTERYFSGVYLMRKSIWDWLIKFLQCCHYIANRKSEIRVLLFFFNVLITVDA